MHGARKDLKKTRALLRLVRPALPGKVYRRENRELRDIARALSSTRDADVLVAVVDGLHKRYDDDLNLRAILHRAGFVPAGRFGYSASSFGEYLLYRRADPAAAAQRLRVQLDRLVLTSRPRRIIRHQNRRLAAVIRPKIGG